MRKRKIDKELIVFVIGLTAVSCLGSLIGASKYGQGIWSLGLFFKTFAIIFFGLVLVVIAVIFYSLWVVLNR